MSYRRCDSNSGSESEEEENTGILSITETEKRN